MDDILQDFLAEAEERLSTLDQDILLLEQNGTDAAALNRIFRVAHNIKGSCGFLQLHRLSRLSHVVEAVLARCRDHQLPVTPALVSLLLSGCDQIRHLVKMVGEQGHEPAGDDSALIDVLMRAEKEGVFDLPDALPSTMESLRQGVAANSLRVHVDVLENLMALTGELVLARNQMLQERVRGGNLPLPLQRLHQLVSSLQAEVLKARMQPVMQGWRSLPRLLHDTASVMKKHARLEMSGGDTALDRHVLETMRDPLSHLLRNAIAHGVETPAERMQQGKPAEGVIRLSATYAEGSVIVTVADDGGGLSLEKIGAQAVAQNLVTPEALSRMGDADIMRFIFMPGFSTAAEASMVAGRGVGLDIVRAAIEKIGGTVRVSSEKGRGTVFTLHLPLTLAILPCIIVSVGEQRYALPQTGVAEMLRLNKPPEILGGQPVLRLRGDIIPLLSLGDVFGLPSGATSVPKTVILRGAAGDAVGLQVDDIEVAEDVVVKPLPAITQRGAKYFLGSALLGGGSLALIVDTNRLIEKHAPAKTNKAVYTPPMLAETQRATPIAKILLFRRENTLAVQAVYLADVVRLVDMEGDDILASGNGQRLLREAAGEFVPIFADTPQARRAIVLQVGTYVFAIAAQEVMDVCEIPAEDMDKTPVSQEVLQRLTLSDGMVELLDKMFFVPQAMREKSIQQSQHAAARKRLLLVDDSPFFCKLMTPILQQAGYAVVTVESAQDALQYCNHGEVFEAVISDIEMPGMNGLEFAKHIRGRDTAWRGMPLLALSAHATQRDEKHGLAAGFDFFVNKFDRDGLLSALQKMKGAA